MWQRGNAQIAECASDLLATAATAPASHRTYPSSPTRSPTASRPPTTLSEPIVIHNDPSDSSRVALIKYQSLTVRSLHQPLSSTSHLVTNPLKKSSNISSDFS